MPTKKVIARHRRAAAIFNPHGSGGSANPKMRKTNPISDAVELRKTRKCKTNPIPAYQVSRQPLFQRNEPKSHRPYDTIMQNEPNPRRGQAQSGETNPIPPGYYAKRTQFQPRRNLWKTKKHETNPIPAYQVSCHPIFTRNEPNSHRPYDTKMQNEPNSYSAHDPNAQNEPNLSPHRQPADNPKMQNEPNLTRPTVKNTKRTQFAPRPPSATPKIRNEPNSHPSGQNTKDCGLYAICCF